MRHIYRLILLCAAGSVLLLTGCATGAHVSAGGPYHVTAYKPHDPSAVRERGREEKVQAKGSQKEK